MSDFKWSYSKLNVYLQCQRKFELSHIKKLSKFTVNDNFTIGTAIHSFLEYFAVNPKATLSKCEQEYLKVVSTDKLEDKDAPQKYLPLIGRYYTSGKRLTPLNSPRLNVERKFSLDCNGAHLTGIIDIITDDMRICDYKTSKNPYKTIQVQESLQLSLYAAWFYEEYKELPYRVGYQVILKDGSGVQELWDERTKEQIENAKRIVARCDKQIRIKKYFARTRTSLCRWCEFDGKC